MTAVYSAVAQAISGWMAAPPPAPVTCR
jgi:hypothetical protein